MVPFQNKKLRYFMKKISFTFTALPYFLLNLKLFFLFHINYYRIVIIDIKLKVYKIKSL